MTGPLSPERRRVWSVRPTDGGAPKRIVIHKLHANAPTNADGDGRGDGVAAFFLPFPLPFPGVLFCFVLPFIMILPDHWTVCN